MSFIHFLLQVRTIDCGSSDGHGVHHIDQRILIGFVVRTVSISTIRLVVRIRIFTRSWRILKVSAVITLDLKLVVRLTIPNEVAGVIDRNLIHHIDDIAWFVRRIGPVEDTGQAGLCSIRVLSAIGKIAMYTVDVIAFALTATDYLHVELNIRLTGGATSVVGHVHREFHSSHFNITLRSNVLVTVVLQVEVEGDVPVGRIGCSQLYGCKGRTLNFS